MRPWFSLILASILAGLPTAAFGDSATRAKSLESLAYFSKFDRNGDGRVTWQEIESYRADWIRRADRNDDGLLVLAEFVAVDRTKPAPELAYDFAQLDLDGDQRISLEEIVAPKPHHFARTDLLPIGAGHGRGLGAASRRTRGKR